MYRNMLFCIMDSWRENDSPISIAKELKMDMNCEILTN